MCIKDVLMAWADRFDNDHYEFDIYGNWVKVDLPKKIVYRLAEISQILVDRVVEAKGELTTADYVKLEEISMIKGRYNQKRLCEELVTVYK